MLVLVLSNWLLCTLPSTAAASTWQAHYSGDVLPDQAEPQWTLMTSGSAADVSVSNGILRIDTLDRECFWEYWLQTSFNNSKGLTVEARLLCEACVQEKELHITISGGGALLTLLVSPNRIAEQFSGLSYAMDTTDTFHKYVITAKEDDFKVYVDEILRIDGTGRHTEADDFLLNYLIFGDGLEYLGYPGHHPYGSLSLWDYITAWDSVYEPPAVVGGRTNQIMLEELPHSNTILGEALPPILLAIFMMAVTKLRKRHASY